MFRNAAIAAIAAVVFSTPALAIDEGLYFGLGGGVGFTQDVGVSLSGPGFSGSGDLEINTGFGVLGAFGYQWKNGFAVEGEIGYRRGSAGDLSGTGTIGGVPVIAFGDLSGSVDALSFLANGRYGFDTGTSFTPFVLGGVGIARIGANDLGGVVDDSDWVFAYQAGAGVNVALGEGFSAEASYRFFGTSGPDFTGTGGLNIDADGIKTHSILLMLKYTFGGNAP